MDTGVCIQYIILDTLWISYGFISMDTGGVSTTLLWIHNFGYIVNFTWIFWHTEGDLSEFDVSKCYETRRNRYEVMKTLSNLKNENSSKLRQ